MSKEAIEYIKSKHKCYVPHLFTPNDCAELMQSYADEQNKEYYSKDDVIDLMVKFYEEVRTSSTEFDATARRYAIDVANETLKQLDDE